MQQKANIQEKTKDNDLELLEREIIYLEEKIKKLTQENKMTKIRIERKRLELQKYWLKTLGF